VIFTAHCGWTLARALAAGAACVLAGAFVRRYIAGYRGGVRRVAWILLVVPYVTPALLVGYGYSHFSLSLVRHPALNELLYGCLVWLRLVPVAAVVLYLAPAPLSAEAAHCRRLLLERDGGVRRRLSYLWFLARSWAPTWITAAAICSLLAFGEFEIASLFGARTWTVALFDAHAGGLALVESLRLAAVPMLVEAAFLVLMLVALVRGRKWAVAGVQPPAGRTGAGRVLLWAYLLAALAAVAVVPGAVALRGAVQGIGTLVRDFVLGKDIGASVVFAAAAAVCAHSLAAPIAARAAAKGSRWRALVPAVLLAVPGLLGPLVLSLVLVFVFQAPVARAAYDTPIPLLLALTLVLFPFALVLQIVLRVFRPREPLHAAKLLQSSERRSARDWARRLIWELQAKRQFWVLLLLFCWGYCDLTASSILAPSAMTPVTVRLYNLMHYGQAAVLSAMVCAAFLVPFILVVVAEGVRGSFVRLLAHG